MFVQPEVRYFRTSNRIFPGSFVSRPLVKGNEDPGYEGVSNHPAHQTFALMGLMHNYVIQCMRVRLGGIAKQVPPFFRECVFLFYMLATNIRL